MHRLARKFAQPLAFLLIAAQLLLAVPAMAGAPFAAPAAAHTPCDDMPTAGSGHHCPCCTDDAASMTDCLVSCLLSAVAAPTITFTQSAAFSIDAFVEQPVTAPAPSQPPLKPPPIA